MDNKYKLAFQDQSNWFIGGVTAMLLLATGNPGAILLGMFAEVAYMMVYPDSPGFQKKLSDAKKAREKAMWDEKRGDMLKALGSGTRDRYNKLLTIQHKIDQELSGKELASSVTDQVANLVDRFLLFASKDVDLRSYIEDTVDKAKDEGFDVQHAARKPNADAEAPFEYTSAKPADSVEEWAQTKARVLRMYYSDQIQRLQASIDSRHPDDVTIVTLKQRLDIANQRLSQAQNICNSVIMINGQMSVMEDTLGLINDNLRARPPRQILSDVQGVVDQTQDLFSFLSDVDSLDSHVFAGV